MRPSTDVAAGTLSAGDILHIAEVYFALGLINYYAVAVPDERWARHGVATLRRRLAS